MKNICLLLLICFSAFSCSKKEGESIDVKACTYITSVSSFPMDNPQDSCSIIYQKKLLPQTYTKIEFIYPSLYEESSASHTYGRSVETDLITQSILYTVVESELQTNAVKKKIIEINYSNNLNIKAVLQNFFNRFEYCSASTLTNQKTLQPEVMKNEHANQTSLAQPLFLKFMNGTTINLELSLYDQNTFCHSYDLTQIDLMFKNIFLLTPNKMTISEEYFP